MHPVSYTNTHYNVTDLVNDGVVTNTKTLKSWEWNITFLWNKKILNLWWHILRSHGFVEGVNLKNEKHKKQTEKLNLGEGPDFPQNNFFIYLFNEGWRETFKLFDLKTTGYLNLHHIEARTDNSRLSKNNFVIF